MVAFQHQHFRPLQLPFHQVAYIACIGYVTEGMTFPAERISCRFQGIVRCREASHLQSPQGDLRLGRQNLPVAKLQVYPWQGLLDAPPGSGTGINGNGKLFHESFQPFYVIDVFVGNKYRRQVFGTKPQTLHTLANAAAGNACVHQHHAGFATHHSGVALAAAGQHRYLEAAHALASSPDVAVVASPAVLTTLPAFSAPPASCFSSSASFTPALQPSRSAPAAIIALAVA